MTSTFTPLITNFPKYDLYLSDSPYLTFSTIKTLKSSSIKKAAFFVGQYIYIVSLNINSAEEARLELLSTQFILVGFNILVMIFSASIFSSRNHIFVRILLKFWEKLFWKTYDIFTQFLIFWL